jgi:tetratricopeptide (TPR) repeat protein
MKKGLGRLFRAAALAAGWLVAACGITPLDRKFGELDDVLSRQKEYAAAYEAGAAPLRDSLRAARSDSARWEAAYGIYSIYKNTQMDSALHYLRMMTVLSEGHTHERFLSGIEEASVNISARNYPAARTFLSSIDTAGLSGGEMSRYYETILLLYATEAHDETLPQEQRENSYRQRYETRSRYIASAVGDPFEAVRRPAIQMYEDGRPDEAIPILSGLVENAPPGLKAHACYSLAKAYQAAGRRDETEFWFAQGAIENIVRPSGEHLSLYELSMMLFEEQRLARALAYSQAVLESELESHYNTWIINSASSQLGIVRAALYREKRQKTVIIGIILLLSILFLTVLAFGHKTFRQARQLRASDVEIRSMNRRLEEAGKIKEGYVFRYIMLSSKYLRMIENYRHSLRVTLKEEGVEALKQKLRQTQIENLNPRQFYAIFDETFLGIFPEFVTHVNSLLKEDARFRVGDGDELPTGLRILAVIKLGITDSGKIAEFLDCATSSVYTHRSRLRHAATCPPEDFERLVAEA